MASLKQRLSAYEDASSSSKSPKTREEQHDLSLEDRKATYEMITSSRKDSPSLSLKDRIPRIATSPTSSSLKKETKLKDRMAVYQPKEDTLQDRMAKFESSESPANRKSTFAPKKKRSDLQHRMEKFKEASSPEATKTKSPPMVKDIQKQTGRLQDRMSMYKETVSPGSELDIFVRNKKNKKPTMQKSFKVKKPAGNDLQQRLSSFVDASSLEAFEKKKPFAEELISPEERGGDLKERMSAFVVSSPDAYVPMPQDKDASEMNKKQPSEKKKSSTTERSDGSGEKHLTVKHKSFEAKKPEPGGDLQERMSKFEEVSSPKAFQNKKLEVHSTSYHASDDLQQRLSAFEEASSPEAFQKKKLSLEEHSPMPEQSGGDLIERMSKFEEVSSPKAFQKKKLEDHGTSHHASDLQQRLSAFEEASSPEAFQKKKPPLEGQSPMPEQSGGDLQERMSKFKEVSSPKAFQKKKLEDHSTSHHADLQQRMSAFVEASSLEAFKYKKLEVERCLPCPVPPPPFNPQEGEGTVQLEKAYMGRVVENKTPPVREGPKDYEYLYDLFVNLEQLKLQEHNSPHLKFILEEGEYNKRHGEEDIKASLEGIIRGNTHYTAKADWLDNEWIDEHLIRDDNFDSLKFQFRDHMLFRRFDKTCEKSRDNIIRIFVNQLLLTGNEITQLDLSSCLLPDRFLQVLAEEVLKNPANSFPRLQLLNLESNVLQGPGIEALSEVIANKTAWQYLQAILLENQKHIMSSEAEKALADAVSRSASIVVCSVSIRCPFHRKDINDALLCNMDQLRLARRNHQAKEGTLKERKRNEIELYFDNIADNKLNITEVELIGEQKFLSLENEEKTRSGNSFATNTSVRIIKMELLGLDNSFAEAFGEAIAKNNTIEKVNIDSNAITGVGVKALFAGLGKNSSIEDFQVRHQHRVMSTLDEESLPELLESNTSILKLGVDVRSQLVKMRLDKIINANRDRLRKLRLDAILG